MKLITLIISFLSLFSFSQDVENYPNKVEQLKLEFQMLEDIRKDYENTIDSLYNLPKTDSTQLIATKLLVDYYILRTNNLRAEMKQMVLLIDALNTIKKED